LKVGGKEVSLKQIPHTFPVIKTFEETFDVGGDTRYDRPDRLRAALATFPARAGTVLVAPDAFPRSGELP